MKVTVKGTVSDGLSGVKLASGTFTVTDSAGTTVPGGAFTVTSTGTYSFATSLLAKTPIGTTRMYTITASAKDKAGNKGSAVTTFTVTR